MVVTTDYQIMCTVTFIPKHHQDFILTSNRDKAPNRQTIPPKKYELNNTELVFPKDELAGGTWIGISEKNRLICLLNGGFTAHERASSYRMSRGIIVTDLLTQEAIIETIDAYNFKGIEPFTIILVDFVINTKLYELVWDGAQAHFSEKPLQPTIWSSSLLYTPAAKAKREEWFSEFMLKDLKPDSNDILKFHQSAGNHDATDALIMNRGVVRTKSITQVQKRTESLHMNYIDLETTTKTQVQF